jgi:hypothetical protein
MPELGSRTRRRSTTTRPSLTRFAITCWRSSLPRTSFFGLAHDTPILGYGVPHVNIIRLWKSEARESLDLQAFNLGDCYGAVTDMVNAQNICKGTVSAHARQSD